MDPNRLLECAREAAQAAGDHAHRNLHRRTDALVRTAHDVKLRLDVESQARAEAVIRSRFPGHAILGEEDTGPGSDGGDAEILWVVDPIDGTVNFSHGMPFWCTSIAALSRGRTLAGVVYAPALQQRYEATLGGGASCNGEPLRVSAVADLKDAIIMTGLDRNLSPALPPLALFHATGLAAQKARVMGSAAIDVCRVATGQADGYFEAGIYLWDIAAGRLIVEEAGGRTAVLREFGGNRLSFAATNGLIHDAYVAVLEGAMRGRA